MFNSGKSVLPNCVSYEYNGVKVPLHFGFITKESAMFADSKGIVDLSFHNVFKITGSDRYSWLSKITSQTFVEQEFEYSKEALILNPQGHVLFAVNVLVQNDCVLLIEQCDLSVEENIFVSDSSNFADVNSGVSEENRSDSLLDGFFADTNIENFLQKMVFMSDVKIENITESTEIIGFVGNLNQDFFSLPLNDFRLLGVWKDSWPNMGAKNASYFNVEQSRELFENLPLDAYTNVQNSIIDPLHPGNGFGINLYVFENFSETKVFEMLCEEYYPCGFYAFESLKISTYRPWGYKGNRLLPHEVDWLRSAVQLNKGCYCGQETVARIVNVGKPPRRLVKLYIDGYMDEIPKRNDLIYLQIEGEKKPIGKVLSVALHHDEGNIGLGLVNRGVDLVEGQVLVGDLSASCEEIVSHLGRCSASPDTSRIADVRRNRLR